MHPRTIFDEIEVDLQVFGGGPPGDQSVQPCFISIVIVLVFRRLSIVPFGSFSVINAFRYLATRNGDLIIFTKISDLGDDILDSCKEIWVIYLMEELSHFGPIANHLVDNNASPGLVMNLENALSIGG